MGKIVYTGTDQDAKVVNETLGYTESNVMSTPADAQIFVTFAKKINMLTTNTYARTTITYEVNLDTIY